MFALLCLSEVALGGGSPCVWRRGEIRHAPRELAAWLVARGAAILL